MLIGMTEEQYWKGDPALLYNYEQVYITKRKLEEQKIWLIGAYIQQAVSSVPLNVNGFIQKGSLGEYPDCPYIEEKGEPLSQEQIELINQARAKFSVIGMLA